MDTKQWLTETAHRPIYDQEIADILGISRKTANKRINDGLEASDLIILARGLGINPVMALQELGYVTINEVFDFLDGDGTPLWDKPLNGSLATVTAHRPDGETLTVPLSDAHGWKHLTSALMEFQEPWETEVTLAMGRLAHAGSRYKRLEAELKELGHERRAMVVECAKLGVIPARLAEAARTSQTAIGKMLPKRA